MLTRQKIPDHLAQNVSKILNYHEIHDSKLLFI
jgi:hypothetical protein